MSQMCVKLESLCVEIKKMKKKLNNMTTYRRSTTDQSMPLYDTVTTQQQYPLATKFPIPASRYM
ncbi:hypothetical protein WN55_01023 [Dufourea novaeangliae]|uniref:Uncharacterized protein n=1 Tax=Dufourea novaeangliae TaxID=178035 RepID=A0A154PDK3_DUFNO|nr:hypothetical protein WN55_01023 [Dufourea novaeangliae]